MSLFKKTSLSFLALMILLTSSAIVPSKPMPNPIVVSSVFEKLKTDGKISTKELTAAIEQIKGSPLTLKEKIGVKLFGKKFAKSLLSTNKNNTTGSGGKSQLIALLLCIFVGGIGIHRFYLGYTWQGVVQLLTGGGCGIWALIDLIRIITGDLKPKDSDYDKTL